MIVLNPYLPFRISGHLPKNYPNIDLFELRKSHLISQSYWKSMSDGCMKEEDARANPRMTMCLGKFRRGGGYLLISKCSF